MADSAPTGKADNPKSKPPVLASAAASGDASVQWLVAVRNIHQANADNAGMENIDRKLAELGFSI